MNKKWDPLSIIKQLRKLPEEAFTRMRNFQGEVGCGNCCADCSQLAVPSLWSIYPEELDKITDLVKIVSLEIASRRNISNAIACDRETRSDTIFPYFDNDLGSSLLLPKLLDNIHKKLGRKSKFTTIGWSRHNLKLQKMHEHINKKQLDTLVAVSFSLTSYTKAWRDDTKYTSRHDYILDLSNALKTYQPAIEKLGTGKEVGCVTLRFVPMVDTFDADLDDFFINGYHLIHSGSYLLISQFPTQPTISQINFNDHHVKFNPDLSPYLLLTSNNFANGNNWTDLAKGYILLLSKNKLITTTENVKVEKVELVKLENKEGIYYAIDPLFQPTGTFTGKYFYHRNSKRPKSGYNDSTRYFLNTLIEYKQGLGLSPNDKLVNSSWDQVNEVMELLRKKSNNISLYNLKVARHIQAEIIPLVDSLISALKLAGYSPDYFFDPGFNVDTGQILNQGRAISDFQGLTITPNLATNPQHLRVISTWNPQTVWRWTIAIPHISKVTKDKNNAYEKTGLVIQELNSADLTNYTSNGTRLREYYINIPLKYEHVGNRYEFIKAFRIPGLRK